MNPNLLGQVARQQLADLHRTAAHRTAHHRTAHHGPAHHGPASHRPASHGPASHGPVPARRGAKIRHRAGWTLIQIGLRLATSSADA